MSINTSCSHVWLEAGRRGTDTEGVQREQRARRRARWPPLPRTCGKAAQRSPTQGPSKSARVQRLRSRLGVCTSPSVPALHTLLRFGMACEAEALPGPSRSVCRFSRKDKRCQWALISLSAGATRQVQNGDADRSVVVLCRRLCSRLLFSTVPLIHDQINLLCMHSSVQGFYPAYSQDITRDLHSGGEIWVLVPDAVCVRSAGPLEARSLTT